MQAIPVLVLVPALGLELGLVLALVLALVPGQGPVLGPVPAQHNQKRLYQPPSPQ